MSGIRDSDPQPGVRQHNPPDFSTLVIRITGGNFRLLQRLLTQMARLVEINALSQVTRDVVEAARETLVIGVG